MASVSTLSYIQSNCNRDLDAKSSPLVALVCLSLKDQEERREKQRRNWKYPGHIDLQRCCAVLRLQQFDIGIELVVCSAVEICHIAGIESRCNREQVRVYSSMLPRRFACANRILRGCQGSRLSGIARRCALLHFLTTPFKMNVPPFRARAPLFYIHDKYTHIM